MSNEVAQYVWIRRPILLIGTAIVVSWLSVAWGQAETNDEANIARLNARVMALYEQGQLDEALLLAKEALTQAKEALGEQHSDTKTAHANLSTVYKALGQDSEAFFHSLQSRLRSDPSRRGSTARSSQSRSLGGLRGRDAAKILEEMGWAQHALPLAQGDLRRQKHRSESQQPADTATSHLQLSRLYVEQGQYAQALSSAQQALTMFERSAGEDHQIASALVQLANVYKSQRQLSQALEHYQRALALQQQHFGRFHPEVIELLRAIAKVQHAQGDEKQALESYRQTLAAEDGVLTQIFALPSQARQSHFFEKVFQDTVMFALSLIRQHFVEDDEAKELGMTWVLRRKGLGLDIQSRHQATTIANLGDEALAVWKRFRANQSILANRMLRIRTGALSADEQEKIRQLNEAITEDTALLVKQNKRLREDMNQVQVTPSQIAQRLPSDSVLIEFVKLPEVQVGSDGHLTRDGERYVAFVLTPANQITMKDLGDTNEINRYIRRVRARLDNALDELKEVKDTDLRPYPSRVKRVDDALTSLYKLLIARLEESIKPYRHLIVSPDGELSSVPFAALRQPDGSYLIETRSLSHVTSGRDLLRETAEVPPGLDLLLVASPTFSAQSPASRSAKDAPQAIVRIPGTLSFAPLPGTLEEAQKIPLLVSGNDNRKRILIEAEATEMTVRQAVSPRILHLATHGFYYGDGERSEERTLLQQAKDAWHQSMEKIKKDKYYQYNKQYLENWAPSEKNRQWLESRQRAWVIPKILERTGIALTGAEQASQKKPDEDGLLTALEVTSMNLQGTDLVVLSACDTAAGKARAGEGLYGLRRAFVLAGAKSLVASLWRTNDGLAVSQMEHFYRELKEGQTVTDALRLAQLRTIAELREYFGSQIGERIAPVWLWAPFLAQQTGKEVRFTSGSFVKQTPYWVVALVVIGGLGFFGLFKHTRSKMQR